MDKLQLIKSENFGTVLCDFWRDSKGDMWFTREQIGLALEYAFPQEAVQKIHERNSDRLDRFSVQVKLTATDGKAYSTTVYSQKGLNEVCRFSRQPRADAFMDWVWDVVESIRKHGMYAKEELLDNPDLLLEVITKLKQEREEKKLLQTENKLLTQQTLEWADRKVIEALVKKYGGKIGYESAWREFKKELLYACGINLNSRITIWRNEHGRKTGPKTLDMIHDEEVPACIRTAVALCKANDIRIDEIIQKYNVA